MNKAFKIYIILFVGVIVLLSFLELGKKEVVDWRKNFDVEEKSPFGLFIFRKEISSLFPNGLKIISESPYSFFENEQKFVPRNILIIDEDMDRTSWEKVLKQVEQGSDLMYIGRNTDALQGKFSKDVLYLDEKAILKLTEQKLQNISLEINKLPSEDFISSVTKDVEILGFYEAESLEDLVSESLDIQDVDNDGVVSTKEVLIEEVVIGGNSQNKKVKKWANFIKFKRGKGNIYVHTDPLFLTNYYLLNAENYKYLEGVFSYLPNRETIWF